MEGALSCTRTDLLHSVRHEIKNFRRALLSEWTPIGQRRCLFHGLRWHKLRWSSSCSLSWLSCRLPLFFVTQPKASLKRRVTR